MLRGVGYGGGGGRFQAERWRGDEVGEVIGQVVESLGRGRHLRSAVLRSACSEEHSTCRAGWSPGWVQGGHQVIAFLQARGAGLVGKVLVDTERVDGSAIEGGRMARLGDWMD